MDSRSYSDRYFRERQEEYPEYEPEDGPNSPSSEDEAAKIRVPSLKKRKSAQKRVVSVPIGRDVNGIGSRGEVYPPSDPWAWRKYGQKPIKGSPYPRGYYRCSSSRGCPARKQVERSRVEPTVLLVTYASDHNHPLPVSSPSRCHPRGRSVAESPAVSAGSPPAEVHADELSGFSCHPDVGGDPLIDLDWLAADVASTSLLESPAWAGEPHELGADVAVAYGVMREEDETLFGDLGELPECTAVFRWRNRRRCRGWRLAAVQHRALHLLSYATFTSDGVRLKLIQRARRLRHKNRRRQHNSEQFFFPCANINK